MYMPVVYQFEGCEHIRLHVYCSLSDDEHKVLKHIEDKKNWIKTLI